VDRLKDAIRRRGENISSFEVEREIMTHPSVREVAVVGIESEFGEADVLAAIVPQPHTTLDPASLIEHLRTRLAHFMIPRYVRTVEALPRTPTHKVQKHLIRAQGVTDDTWDREAAGIRIRAVRLR
jgi:crotonobetaine/carnitine-CoA ligase